MTAKEFLSQAYRIDQRIDRKIEEAARLRAKLTQATAVISDMPKGGGVSDWTNADIKVMELENAIKAEITELCKIKRQIKEAIDAVDDKRYRDLLEMRYRDMWSWEQIAVEMSYTYRHVTRMHGKALRAIKVPESSECP